MNTKNVIGLLAGLVLAWGNVQAQTAGPKQPFSAQAVQQVPGQSPKTANMYVDPHHVRMEYRMGGRKVIEIVDLDHQRALTAFPELGVYVEMQAPQNVIRQATQNAGMQSPCDLVPQATCKYLGQERLFGRVTDKWQMTYQREGKTLQALYWIDRARRMPLRQVFPGGTTTEMKPAGMDTINGRRVEKWVLTTTRPDGQVMTSQQWFDPQLGIAIRETMQGGYLRELRNIRVGPQDPSLFALPPGLRKIDMAQLQQLLRGQAGGSRQGMPATPQGRPTAP
ncbi:MAG: hypothetical protein D6721_05575, partial [Gammaproteobacteria bacterium]